MSGAAGGSLGKSPIGCEIDKSNYLDKLAQVFNERKSRHVAEAINTALQKVEDEIIERLGKDIRALFEAQIDAATRHLANSSVLGPGDTAPGFDLRSSDQGRVSLAETLRNGKVILTFYRGSWCNFCNMALRHWQARLPDIQRGGATLLAIAPETPAHAAKFQAEAGISYALLSDPDNAVADAYGLSFELPPQARRQLAALGTDVGSFNGNGNWSVPITATFLVDQNGQIVIADSSPDYRQRLEPSEIISAL